MYVVNAVRRTILTDIPTVVFDTTKENVEFSVNTCKLHNKLKQRLVAQFILKILKELTI